VIGFILTFLPQYVLGAEGMPRRIADYAPSTGWQGLNALSTLGGVIMALGMIPFLVAVVRALRGPRTAGDDPWEGNSLEWATSSPPPHHNFDKLPRIRSERPVFDARMAAAATAAAETADAASAAAPGDPSPVAAPPGDPSG
jgi:cytochrome c oxidase subunit 1